MSDQGNGQQVPGVGSEPLVLPHNDFEPVRWCEEDEFIDKYASPFVTTPTNLRAYARKYRDEFMDSGFYIPGRGRRPSFYHPNLIHVLLEAMRREEIACRGQSGPRYPK